MTRNTTSPRQRHTLRTLDDLVDAGLIEASDASDLSPVADRFATAITPGMAALIGRADPADPIAAQFVPTAAERFDTPDEHPDPIADAAHSPVAGIIHRYPDRVLLKATKACPVYCRFCFRRADVGKGPAATLSPDEMTAAVAYIANRPEIWEVVVTGGDPLAMSARRIADISQHLSAIDHVRVIRWHSRVPVVAPDLIDDARASALAAPLAAGRAAVFVSVHANHPRELTDTARHACRRLAHAGVALVSQSVLLRGVNDEAATLAALMRAFVETGIKPYYLHVLDRAPATSHFGVPLAEARAVVRDLRGHLSGLCQPTLVIDIPGGHGKVLAAESDVVAEPDPPSAADAGGQTAALGPDVATDRPRPRHDRRLYRLRDRNGRIHRYIG